jgi:hypothetical protein
MPDISSYQNLVPSQHADKPKFMAMLTLWAQAFVDNQNLLLSLPDEFDLDNAIGVQLDAIGEWVGYSRNVETPIPNVYFSFDTVGLGWDQGVIKGPFDPTEGLTLLDDSTYRTMLRLKISANGWKGDLPTAATLLASVFSMSGTNVYVDDGQDMTMTVGIAGTIPSALILALIKAGSFFLKPASVTLDPIVTSVDGAPIFGFDVSNEFIAGWDVGAIGTPLT